MSDLVIDNGSSLARNTWVVDPNQEKRVDIQLAAYEEVCNSYHAIDDFRTKLLGILPIASLGLASFFAAAFTLHYFCLRYAALSAVII
ncbi:MAG: hypothetical protein LC794_04825 [Acidobacteria bacterium]|nr:hypothetical protein [Acidobacteriota bacterium]